MDYSYERVSTLKQDEKRQEIKLNNFKIDKRYIDKCSGKNSDRPQLHKLMLEAKQGDTIYIESISRLGRNVDDLRKLCDYFTEKGVTIHFVKEGIITEGTSYKFLLTILGAVAEMERELIVERVNEGIQKAKEFGTKSGKPIGRQKRSIESLPKDFEKQYRRVLKGELTKQDCAKILGIGRASLYRYIDIYNKEGK